MLDPLLNATLSWDGANSCEMLVRSRRLAFSGFPEVLISYH